VEVIHFGRVELVQEYSALELLGRLVRFRHLNSFPPSKRAGIPLPNVES
jgi:hypothetical protein